MNDFYPSYRIFYINSTIFLENKYCFLINNFRQLNYFQRRPAIFRILL